MNPMDFSDALHQYFLDNPEVPIKYVAEFNKFAENRIVEFLSLQQLPPSMKESVRAFEISEREALEYLKHANKTG